MVFTLLQHPSAWNLPSVDVACIEAQVYLRLAGAAFRVEDVATRVGAEQIPALEDGDEVVMANESGGIPAYLRETKGIDLDSALTATERADAEALSALVHLRLHAALRYSLWLEEANYRLCQDAYAPALPFPLNRVLAFLAHKQADAQFQTDEGDAAHVRAEVYRQAERAYAALATRLADQRYFFGSRPSSVDAAVFAHLLFLEKAPLAETSLKTRAFSHPNLVKYVKRLELEVLSARPDTPREPPPFTRSPGQSSWRGWWGGKVKKEDTRTEEEKRLTSRAWYFVGAQLAAILAYVVFSSLEVEEMELEEDYEDL